MLAAICDRQGMGIPVGVKLLAAGVHSVQRWRGELIAEFGWLPGDQGPLPQQEQLTSMTGRAAAGMPRSAGLR